MLPIARGSISVTMASPTIWVLISLLLTQKAPHPVTENSGQRYHRQVRGSTLYTLTALSSACCTPSPACLSPYVSFNRIYECASFLNSPPNVPPPPSSLLRHGSLPYQSGLCITLRPFSISRYAIDLVPRWLVPSPLRQTLDESG